ncbi:phage holin family protein [filamentous cyanobacterium LEGE 11480]|uniref:Phage holin family protein n=1 Tax=Romeriopsis navalis LEGE 11480 TaxID=2777977 RepID=A0A928VLA9_9CYAN|nr:phage holin family protein [Romeriopsis navalis]MBE9028615.1 phage holin family protein [Romeriopsis navalis LEGE 11480]
MSWIIGILVTMVVVALGLLIVSKIPGLGVEVDSFGIAVVSAIVFGVLNGLLGWLVNFFNFTVLLAPLAWVLNVVIFGLAAWLVQGFRLRNGILSAVLGAIALAVINQIVFALLGKAGITAATAITSLSIG